MIFKKILLFFVLYFSIQGHAENSTTANGSYTPSQTGTQILDPRLKSCISPSQSNPCNVVSEPIMMNTMKDLVTQKTFTGCYDFNFKRISDASSSNTCTDPKAPVYIGVGATTHCAKLGATQCTQSSYVRTQIITRVDSENKNFFFDLSTMSLTTQIPFILSAATNIDKMQELCKSLKDYQFTWDPISRTCTQPTQGMCTELGLTWDGTKCVPPSLFCGGGTCGDSGQYCQGYLYKNGTNSCFCTGTKTDGRCAMPAKPAHSAPRVVEVQCRTCSNPLHQLFKYEDPKCNCRCPNPQVCGTNKVWSENNCQCNCTLQPSGNWLVDIPSCSYYCGLQPSGNWQVDGSCNYYCPLQPGGNWRVDGGCNYYCSINASSCASNQVFNQSTCNCDTVTPPPDGCNLSAGTCSASNQYFDSANCQCTGCNLSCGAGQTLDSGSCSCKVNQNPPTCNYPSYDSITCSKGTKKTGSCGSGSGSNQTFDYCDSSGNAKEGNCCETIVTQKTIVCSASWCHLLRSLNCDRFSDNSYNFNSGTQNCDLEENGGGNPCATAGCVVRSLCLPLYCFVAGTKILLANGHEKNIENIQKGDKIISFDERTQQKIIGTVEHPIAHESRIQKLHHFEFVDGTKLTSNGDHPFYVVEKDNWLEANQIYKIYQAGVKVSFLNIKNKKISIKKMTIENKKVPVYNLEVDGISKNDDKYGKWGRGHNYYANGILSHNKIAADSSGVCPTGYNLIKDSTTTCNSCPSGTTYNGAGSCCGN